MSVGSDDLLALLRRRGLASARELQDALGISQPTLSRLIARARSELVVVGRARSVRYAARDSRSTFFAGVPLHRVGGDGRVTAFGTLVPLASGGTALLRERGDSRTFAGLPWFVEELRPQGFLGRLSVRALVAELRLPPDARSWASDHLLQALSVRGDDLPGDLLVGDAALERYLRRRLEAPARVDRSEYARIIEAQLAGDMPGSSAGGEQPKFACFGGTPARELLVKYSPPIAESPAGRRWADLLCCEELALRVLGEGGLAVARAEYVEVDGRAFLEVDRFDRTEQGRIAVVTGALVDAEFVGSGAWVPLARGLAQQRRLSGADAETVQLLHLFGGLIGNTDMHLGNLALFTEDYESFRLSPAYDMLPMALRPTAHGELPRTDPQLPLPKPEHASHWLRAADLAQTFFSRIRSDQRLDPEMHAYAERLGRTVASMAKMVSAIV